MICPGAVTALRIDRLMDRLADRNLARLDGSSKDMKPAKRLGRILDFSNEAFERRQFSCVANLTASRSTLSPRARRASSVRSYGKPKVS